MSLCNYVKNLKEREIVSREDKISHFITKAVDMNELERAKRSYESLFTLKPKVWVEFSIFFAPMNFIRKNETRSKTPYYSELRDFPSQPGILSQ